jgi:L-ascorbate metabolism protein UlaG (beta-lactamase superfamily)
MKFRWLGEACLEIVADRRHLLVDPNFELDPQPDVDLILVTHEHDDHFRDEARELGAPFWAPRSAVDAFDLEATVVEPGHEDGEIEVVPSFCYGSEESVGYLVHGEDDLLHLGDSFRSPEVETDVVFVPIFADYHEEILEAIETCGASRAYPIHYDPGEKGDLAQELVEKIRARGVESAVLPMGEWVELPA